ncbi:hypothetical protein [Okeania sp. SIO2B3]|uniref:hypothetical protein n=1 Tax=Okeania sp. SIO2B3 TaxID=2607784 RepID=UPI0025F4BD73|nr:hypothetical protein [Okeania sp. SIO2B3]
MKIEFEAMIDFVIKHFPNGFRSGKNLDKTTSRVKFESLSVGIALALREKNNLQYQGNDLLNTKEFKEYAKRYASSSKVKVARRIEYARDRLLGK